MRPPARSGQRPDHPIRTTGLCTQTEEDRRHDRTRRADLLVWQY